MNKFIALGRLTNKPELRYTDSQKGYTKFAIAVPRTFNRDETDFINCMAWGKTAEIIAKHFDKGSQILVEGSVQTGSYENADGKKVYTTDINVERVDFVGTKKETEESNEEVSHKEEEIDPYAFMGDHIAFDDADIE